MSEHREQGAVQPVVLPSYTVKILMVEDEELFAKAVRKRLERAGYACEVAGSLREAGARIADSPPDLVLLDMRLPDGSGLDFLHELRERRGSQVPVLVLSAYGELEDVVAAMKLKATDYLKKPIDLDELLANVEKVLAKSEMVRQLEYSRMRERHAVEGVQLLGEAPAIRDIRVQAERIGRLCGNVEVVPPTVLILGETGTGKDMAARLLHAVSPRRERPFVQVDCATLPKDLIEAELFGHERGAFTNAHAARTGLIEAAEDGVLFLDEIGELPLELQGKLLAVLERRLMRRVGSTQERPVGAWFIAATNRNLEQMVRDGEFRSDLFFRLNVLTLSMPPLRDRGDDIQLLARHFAHQTARRYGLADPAFSRSAVTALTAYAWPGNVRELKHLVERAVLLSGGGEIQAEALMLGSGLQSEAAAEQDLETLTLEEAERRLIENALRRSEGNVSEAARQLGVTRMAMRYRMKKHGLQG